MFTAGDRECGVFVDCAEVVGVFDRIDGFFEPLPSCRAEFGFEGERGVEIEA